MAFGEGGASPGDGLNRGDLQGSLTPVWHSAEMIQRLCLWLLCLFATPALAEDMHLWSGADYLACVTCPASNPKSACNESGAGSRYAANSIFNPNGRFGTAYGRASPWNPVSHDPDLPELRGDSGQSYGVFTLNTDHPRAFFRAAALAQVYRAAEGDIATVRRWICHEAKYPRP